MASTQQQQEQQQQQQQQLTQPLVVKNRSHEPAMVTTKSSSSCTSSLFAHTMALGQSITRKWSAVAELPYDVMNMVGDVNSAVGAIGANWVSSLEDREIVFSFGREPYDAEIIIQHTKFGCQRSCQRAILELCAVTLSNRERRQILGLKGSSNACRDALFKELRRPGYMKFSYAYGQNYGFMGEQEEDEFSWMCDVTLVEKRRWYDESYAGQLQILDGLYRVISENPEAFCQLLAC